MKITQYQVDAFATRAFEGNPAAICPLEAWLPDTLMQAIAEENNLAETAFFVPAGDGFELRWMTPLCEVDLCGHATLAAAHVIFEKRGYPGPRIAFATRSGTLYVEKHGSGLRMDFPASIPQPCEVSPALVAGLGCRPQALLAAEDYLAVVDSEQALRDLRPDFAALASLDRRGVIVTAAGSETDFVSRFFAPKLGVPEDPVTGSAHCQLAPYWAARLGKRSLSAKQLSRRGGRLECELAGDRVLLSGSAVIVIEGELAF